MRLSIEFEVELRLLFYVKMDAWGKAWLIAFEMQIYA